MLEKPTWVRWRITALLIFASFVDYFLRYNLSIAAPAMIADLGLSEIQWGWVMAAFPLGYALFQLPGGAAADRHGPRRVLTIAMLAWGVLTALTAAVPGPGVVPVGVTIALLVLVAFAVGVTHAPIYPTVACTVRRWFPLNHWGLPNGLTSTGLTWGAAAVTPALVALIALAGWRVGFVAIAPMAFIGAALWWWYARDNPREHPAANAAEVALITANRPNYGKPVRTEGSWKQVVRNRDLLLLTLSYSCMNYLYYTQFSWFFYYIDQVMKLETSLSVTVTASQWIAGGLAAALGGWVCDRLCQKLGYRWGCRAPVVFAMLASGAALAFGLLSDNVMFSAAWFVAFFFFNQFSEGPYWSASMAIGRRLSGSAGGVMNTGANAMGVVMTLSGPIIAAWLGWTAAMGSAVLFAVLAAVLMMFVRADREVELT